MVSTLISSVVGVLFVCSAIEAMKLSVENELSIAKRSAEEDEIRFIETWKKLAKIAEESKFTYFGVFASNIAEYGQKLLHLWREYPNQTDSEKNHRILNGYEEMQREIFAELRVIADEKSHMKPAQFDEWQGKWVSTKAVTKVVLLTLFGNSENGKIYFMFAEIFVMLIIALVEDFPNAENALSTVQALVRVFAEFATY